jgi:hypothetical protein
MLQPPKKGNLMEKKSSRASIATKSGQIGTEMGASKYTLHIPAEIRDLLDERVEKSRLPLSKLLRLYITTMLIMHRELDPLLDEELPTEYTLPLQLGYAVSGFKNKGQGRPAGKSKSISERNNGYHQPRKNNGDH